MQRQRMHLVSLPGIRAASFRLLLELNDLFSGASYFEQTFTPVWDNASFACRSLYPNPPAFMDQRTYTHGMKTVLVVDDDEAIRKFVHLALDKRGWTVLEAEDGIDGVARFMLHHPNALITDISMPNSDGFELIDVLRKAGCLEGVHLVVMSGVLNLETLEAKKTGANALLSKPFSLQELFQAMGD